MTLKRILGIAAVVEAATGLALIVDPKLVVELLLGVYAPWTSLSIGRVAGVALLALGISCWPEGGPARTSGAAWRGMLTYNLLVAAYLAYLSAIGGIGGVMLWPAVALHALMAAALLWKRADAMASGPSPRGE